MTFFRSEEDWKTIILISFRNALEIEVALFTRESFSYCSYFFLLVSYFRRDALKDQLEKQKEKTAKAVSDLKDQKHKNDLVSLNFATLEAAYKKMEKVRDTMSKQKEDLEKKRQELQSKMYEHCSNARMLSQNCNAHKTKNPELAKNQNFQKMENNLNNPVWKKRS